MLIAMDRPTCIGEMDTYITLSSMKIWCLMKGILLKFPKLLSLLEGYASREEVRMFYKRRSSIKMYLWRGRGFTNVTKNIICFRSEEHTSELQSRENLVCRLL